MMPSYDSAGAGASISAQASINVPYPATVAANDLLIMHMLFLSAVASPSPPTGWTTIREASGIYSTYYKVATGSESGNLTVPLSGTVSGVARMYRFTSVNVSGTPYESMGFDDTHAPADGFADDVGVTTLGADRLAINLLGILGGTHSSFTGETGGDWVESAAYDPGRVLQLQSANMPSAGTIDGGRMNLGATNTYWNLGFALLPGADAPDTGPYASDTAPIISGWGAC